MKKLIVGFIAGIIFATAGAVYADEGLQKIEAYLRPTLPITLDSKSVTLESSPIVYNGSTYLKLRDVSKLTGLQVNRNDKTQTVELGTIVTPKGAMTTMVIPATPTTPTETTYQGLRAVIKNGITYFSPGDYERKYFKDGKKDGKLVWKFENGDYTKMTIYDGNDQVKTVLDIKDENNLIIYNGDSYLNVQYFPK